MNNSLNIRQKGYFEGWYFKQQGMEHTVAFIPAFHTDNKGYPGASLQIITDNFTYNFNFPAQMLRVNRKKFTIELGKNIFSKYGCKINLESKECSAHGNIRFGPLLPPVYDIMGPFCFVPFMECRHSVFSVYHRVDGEVLINGRNYYFENAAGYIEGDRGRSFPKGYIWTQCSWNENSIMISVAEIPFGLFKFVGCIGIILFNGKEYRIATYCGAKVMKIGNNFISLKQGSIILEIKLLYSNSFLLNAPQSGIMTRKIRESAACRVRYTCYWDNEVLFDFVSDRASFENNWQGAR